MAAAGGKSVGRAPQRGGADRSRRQGTAQLRVAAEFYILAAASATQLVLGELMVEGKIT